MIKKLMACHVLASILIFISACSLSAMEDARPLNSMVEIDLVGKDMFEVCNQINSIGNLQCLPMPDVVPGKDMKEIKIYLQARNITLRHALDWVARSINARYRVLDDGRAIQFSTSYSWLEDKEFDPVTEVYNITPNNYWAWDKRDQFMQSLRELLKPVALRGSRYTISFDSAHTVLSVTLPPALKSRLDAVLNLMREKGRNPAIADAEETAAIPKPSKALSKPVILDMRDATLPEVITMIGIQTEANIGFAAYEVKNDPFEKVDVKIGRTTLKDALDKVCELYKLGGYLIDGENSFWLAKERGSCPFTGTRELLWENLDVKSYWVKNIVDAMGADIVVLRAKTAISNDALQDPSVAVIYHEKSENLIVIAPHKEQLRVGLLLGSMFQEITNGKQ